MSKKLFKADRNFHAELIGLSAQLADNRPYGKIVGAFNFGAGDVIEITLLNGKTEMLPLKSAFVGEINKEKGYMVIHPPEYLEAKEEK